MALRLLGQGARAPGRRAEHGISRRRRVRESKRPFEKRTHGARLRPARRDHRLRRTAGGRPGARAAKARARVDLRRRRNPGPGHSHGRGDDPLAGRPVGVARRTDAGRRARWECCVPGRMRRERRSRVPARGRDDGSAIAARYRGCGHVRLPYRRAPAGRAPAGARRERPRAAVLRARSRDRRARRAGRVLRGGGRGHRPGPQPVGERRLRGRARGNPGLLRRYDGRPSRPRAGHPRAVPIPLPEPHRRARDRRRVVPVRGRGRAP